MDDQLQLIADKLGLLNDARQPATTTTPRQQATSTGAGSNCGAAAETSRRSNGSDDRRRRRDDCGGRTKSSTGKNGRPGTDAAAGTKLDGANWQLKSPPDSERAKRTARPAVNGSKHNHSGKTIAAQQLNGQAGNDRARNGRGGGVGQTSTELKKRRSTQRQNGARSPTPNHDDWLLTSTSVVDKKPESVAAATNPMFSNNGCCALM